LEKEVAEKSILSNTDEKLENVGVERINMLRSQKAIIEKANSESLGLNDEIWNFITTNQIAEVFPYLLKKLQDTIKNEQTNVGSTDKFYKLFVDYLNALPEENKRSLLYNGISEQSEPIA